MKTCPTCGNSFDDETKFCPDDGTALKTKVQNQDPMMGRRLMDRWEVIDRIGSGGFGTVYKVRDLRFDYLEALKVFDRRKLNPDEVDEAIARFRREAMLLKRLGNLSQNIVGVSNMEDDEEGGFIYFTMELVEGENLSQILVREGALHPDRAVAIMKQICKALSVAHNYEEGIVHRDLKLENVMITRDKKDEEVVKILDFGIAKAIGQQSLTNLTMGGPGTPGYAAPEQVEGREIDQRTDLFALGVVFYGMLTGREPWLGGFITEPSSGGWTLLKQSVDGDPIPAHRWDPEIPKQLEDIVFKLLEKRPENRFQTSEEIWEALDAFERGASEPAPSKGTLRVLSSEPGIAIRVKQGVFKTVAEGRTPWEGEGLEPGSYTIQVRDDRYEKEVREVEVTADSAVEITLTAAPLVDARGSIVVETPEEGVRVRLRDGLKSLGEGTTPWEAAHLPPGDYKIEIIDNRYARESRPVRIVANEEATVRLRPRSKVDLPLGEKLKEAAKSPAFLGVAAMAVALAVAVPKLIGGGVQVDYVDFERDYVEPGLVSVYQVSGDKLIATVVGEEGPSAVEVPLRGERLQQMMRRLSETEGLDASRGEGELVFEPAYGAGGPSTPPRLTLRSEEDGTEVCAGCAINEALEIPTGWYAIDQASLEWNADGLTATSEVYAAEELGDERLVFVPVDGSIRLQLALSPTPLGRTLGNAQNELRKGTQQSLGEALRWVEQALTEAPENPTGIAVRDSIAQGYLSLGRQALQSGDGALAGTLASSCQNVTGTAVTDCGQLLEDARAQVIAQVQAEAQQAAATTETPDGQPTGEVVATAPPAAERFVANANRMLAANDLSGALNEVQRCEIVVGSGAAECRGIRTRVLDAYLNRARTELNASRFDAAETAAAECLTIDSGNGQCRLVRAGVSFRRGQQAVQAGNLDQAIQFAQACSRDNPGAGAPSCGEIVRSVANRHYETARTAFLAGQVAQANQAVQQCRAVESGNSECNALRSAIDDYTAAQRESQAGRHADARTLANQCLRSVPGATPCQTIVNRAEEALAQPTGPTPAELAQTARTAFAAGRTAEAEQAVQQCRTADANNAACNSVRDAIASFRSAEQAVGRSNWEQAKSAAQQCLSAVSGARPCTDIVTRADREIAAAAAAAAAPPTPSVSVSNLDVGIAVAPGGKQFQVTPSFRIAGGSGAFCAVALFADPRYDPMEVRQEFQASAGSVTMSFDPEGGDTFLPRADNTGNFRYKATILIYGQGCGQAPRGGGGQPLQRLERDVCFYRTIQGVWYAECPVP